MSSKVLIHASIDLRFIGLVLLAVMLTGELRPSLASAAGPELRVMSFNIRYGTANDGENHWDHRREFVISTIRAFHPDLLGTQETLEFQRDYLAEHLPEYEVLGVGRNDGKADGEMMALYYRRDRFRKLDAGHFWLSETPQEVGSKSWDSSLPRMVTWVRLHDLQQPDGTPIVFLNTHFDHRGIVARRESASLLRRHFTSFNSGESIVLTGDFNAAEGSEPWTALFANDGDQPSPVLDSFRTAHAKPGADEGTFSGFRRSSTSGPRIDWIGVSRDWKIISAEIDRTAKDQRTPSDHFPVTAVLTRP